MTQVRITCDPYPDGPLKPTSFTVLVNGAAQPAVTPVVLEDGSVQLDTIVNLGGGTSTVSAKATNQYGTSALTPNLSVTLAPPAAPTNLKAEPLA
jgi:hypothetical protein